MPYPNLLDAVRADSISARRIAQVTGLDVDDVFDVLADERDLTEKECQQIHNAFFTQRDYDLLFSKIEKQPEPVVEELEQVVLSKKAIDCAARQLKVFWNQSVDEVTADTVEACTICPHQSSCKANLFERIKPLFSAVSIPVFSLAGYRKAQTEK